MTSPSPFAERVLAFVVRNPEWRDAVIGDLREEHGKLVRRVGAVRAARWHRRQAIGVAIQYGTHRLLRRRTPPPRWLALTTDEPHGPWTTGLSRDVLYAWRSVARRPALSGVIVMTLALALAANSTTFSLMDAIVLRPYRFPGVARLIVVGTNPIEDTLFDRESVSAADFREWVQRSASINQWAAYGWWNANLSGVDIPEEVAGFRVSPGFFQMLGSSPAMGREFVESEATIGQHRKVVLGHRLWTRRFAANPAIVGTTVRFDGEPYEVVGVAPEGFRIPLGAEAWSPLALTDEQWSDRRSGSLSVYGRLADGASFERARAELRAIGDTQRRDYPDTNSTRGMQVLSFTDGNADPGAGAFLAVWQAAAGLLLLIACANIANLLMARGSERAQEYGVRLALGASRGRIFWQTLVEGLILSLLAVAAAMPLLAAGLAMSRASIPASVIRFVTGFEYIRFDLLVVVVTTVIGVMAMLLFTMVPALQAMRAQVAESLRQTGRSHTPGRSRQWTRSVLATTQIALALALLFGSSLAITASNRVVNGTLGFDKRNVLVGQLTLPERTYADEEKRRQFISRVLETMRQIPAVTDAGFTSNIPSGFSNNSRRFFPEGHTLTENEARWANYRRVTSGYFTALRIPLLQGRRFDDRDRIDTTPVAVVSAGLARAYWPDQDPIGQRFKLTLDGSWVTVIGVSGDVVHNWFVQRRDTTVYRPVSQEAPLSVAFAMRTVGEPAALASDLRRAVGAADPDQPIAMLTSLEDLVEERAAGFSFIANSLGIVALIALVLSVMGIYSLMAYLTTQRTQEIGVRMALGASRWQVIRLTTAHALRITVAGTVVGAALSFGVGRLMQSVLFGLVSTSVVQLIALVLVLALAALMAAYLPARRAARIDPMNALRES